MLDLKVGDEVHVHNYNSHRNGRVIANLRYPDTQYPLVVEHDGFDGKPGFKTSETKVYTRFNYEGEVVDSSKHVHLKPRTTRVACNVYYTPGSTSSCGPWVDIEEITKYRGSSCIGYLSAVRHKDDKISEVEFHKL